MRWQEAKPGIERAACVMRPMKDDSGIIGKYIRAEQSGYVHGKAVVVAGRAPVKACGLLGFVYDDDQPQSRIISAPRVESAVETQTFLDICEDEGLCVTRFNGRWYASGDSSGGVPSKSLRGAYLNYHAEVQS